MNEQRKPQNTPTQQFDASGAGAVVSRDTTHRRKPREHRLPRVTVERVEQLREQHPQAVARIAKTRSGLYRVDMVSYIDPTRIKPR